MNFLQKLKLAAGIKPEKKDQKIDEEFGFSERGDD